MFPGIFQENMENNLKDWLRLWHIPGIGPRSFNFLLNKFDYRPEHIFASDYPSLIARDIPERIARAIKNHHSDDYLLDLEWQEQSSEHHILLKTDMDDLRTLVQALESDNRRMREEIKNASSSPIPSPLAQEISEMSFIERNDVDSDLPMPSSESWLDID